ncbi:MAG: hypothetical protein DRJ03_01170 [Chloroflexi bacterium]|nr:MAG: hypothetical protein DRJ03_01170 [Chloroflexota bacterium]
MITITLPKLLQIVNESGFFPKPKTLRELIDATLDGQDEGTGTCAIKFNTKAEAENFVKYLKRVLGNNAKSKGKKAFIHVIINDEEDKP